MEGHLVGNVPKYDWSKGLRLPGITGNFYKHFIMIFMTGKRILNMCVLPPPNLQRPAGPHQVLIFT